MTDSPTTDFAIRAVQFLISTCREDGAAAIAEMEAKLVASPESTFQWGQNYYTPLVRARIAERVQSHYDRNPDEYDTSDGRFERDRWFDAIATVTDSLTESILRDHFSPRSSSPFANACVEIEREVTCRMIRELSDIRHAFRRT